MYDSRTVGRRDEVTADNVPTFFVNRDEVEPAFVFLADQIASRHARDHFGFRHDREPLFGEDQKFILVTNLYILNVRIYSESDVGDQRPGSRRPNEKICVLLAFALR